MKKYNDFYQLPVYHIKILLSDFNTNERRENIFQPTIGDESVDLQSNDNGIRLVNFATSKNSYSKEHNISTS